MDPHLTLLWIGVERAVASQSMIDSWHQGCEGGMIRVQAEAAVLMGGFVWLYQARGMGMLFVSGRVEKGWVGWKGVRGKVVVSVGRA